MKEIKSYGTALPGFDAEPYSGKLIVIEGTDGVGRSTHVALLRTSLESAGHAVLDTGMTRSVLAGRGIRNARAGNTLGSLTLQLFYATDFADRLEKEMLPALPDAVFYLRLRSTEELAARVLASGHGFDYWESGMDLHLGSDYYDSFVAYQKLLLREFDRMSGEYGFQMIDTGRPIRRVAAELRRAVKRVIGDELVAESEEAPAAATAATPDTKKAPSTTPDPTSQQESA